MRKILFLTSTPYQVFNAIVLMNSLKNVEADIYIIDQFFSAKELGHNLQETSLFNKVAVFEFSDINKGNKLVRYMKKIPAYMRYERIAGEYFDLNIKYDEVYLTHADIIYEFAISAYKKRNPELIVNMYEDGTEAYVFSEFSIKPIRNFYKTIVHYLCGMPYAFNKINKYYVYEPSVALRRANGELKSQLPKINPNNMELRDVLNKAFSFENGMAIDQEYVVLQQPYECSVDDFQMDVFKRLSSEKFIDNVIFKLHPRTKSDVFDKYNVYKYKGVPWEIICLNTCIDSKVIISYFSTACITPKYIFDMEPHLIFLIDMYPDFIKYDECKAQIESIRNLYKDKSKVYLPKDYSELVEIINSIG